MNSKPVVSMGNAVSRRNDHILRYLTGLRLTESAIVLDIGAGQLRKEGFAGAGRYLATDIRILPGLDFAADAGQLPFSSNSVDVVLGLELLEHVPHPHKILAESARVLVAGGTAIFSVPATFPRHDSHDYWRFTSQGLGVLAADFFPEREVLSFGHTFESLAVLVGYYLQLAAHRHVGYLERLVPVVERMGEKLDNRVAWARSAEGLHTLQSDLLLVART